MQHEGVSHAQGVRRLSALYQSIVERFGPFIVAEEEDDEWIVEPKRAGAVGISWYYADADDLHVQLLTTVIPGGGRWELWQATADMIDRVEDMVWSVAAGRVVEIMERRTSTVRLTLADGSVEEETGSGLAAVFPLPRGRHRGQVTCYAAWTDEANLGLEGLR